MAHPLHTTVEQRDAEIQIALDISRSINDDDTFFVLTGSYSIDALTSARIKHNDIDANIFTDDVPNAVDRAITHLGDLATSPIELPGNKNDRLEFFSGHSNGLTKVELQFLRYDEFAQIDNGLLFFLSATTDHEVIVPTTTEKLVLSGGKSIELLVKTLPYAIGTWALRLTGIALEQKRPVRKSDIDHFRELIAVDHDEAETLHAMQHHPQMPDFVNPADVLQEAHEMLRGGMQS